MTPAEYREFLHELADYAAMSLESLDSEESDEGNGDGEPKVD